MNSRLLPENNRTPAFVPAPSVIHCKLGQNKANAIFSMNNASTLNNKRPLLLLCTGQLIVSKLVLYYLHSDVRGEQQVKQHHLRGNHDDSFRWLCRSPFCESLIFIQPATCWTTLPSLKHTSHVLRTPLIHRSFRNTIHGHG